jgi:hypothetical protein
VVAATNLGMTVKYEIADSRDPSSPGGTGKTPASIIMAGWEMGGRSPADRLRVRTAVNHG